jgi:hypothetical protein
MILFDYCERCGGEHSYMSGSPCEKCGGTRFRVKTRDVKAEKLEEFRGLRAEDLCDMNPSYSCVICGKTGCPICGQYRKSCPDHQPCTEELFAARYDFWAINKE